MIVIEGYFFVNSNLKKCLKYKIFSIIFQNISEKTLTKLQKYSKMENVKEWVFCARTRKGVGKALKRLVATFLVLVMLVLQSVCCYAREVSTYDVLLNMDPILIERFLEGGLSEEMIRSFMGVLDDEADKLQKPEDRETLENYFLSLLLLYIFQQEKYIPVMVTFDQYFQEEVNYIAETGRVPESMEIFFLSVMGNNIAYVPPAEEDPEIDPETGLEPAETPAPTPPPPLPFKDMEGFHWAVPAVQYLKDNDYISGYDDGSFRPETPMTRAELCSLVTRVFLDESYRYEVSRYSDVTSADWFYQYLLSAEYFSLFQWIYEGEFCPEEFVTRQEMCAVIYRAYRRNESDLARLQPRYDFLDFSQISSYAYDPIQRLQQAGCVNGYENGEFLPLKLATRAEVAKVIATVLWLS